jgi:hypothetical protein
LFVIRIGVTLSLRRAIGLRLLGRLFIFNDRWTRLGRYTLGSPRGEVVGFRGCWLWNERDELDGDVLYSELLSLLSNTTIIPSSSEDPM